MLPTPPRGSAAQALYSIPIPSGTLSPRLDLAKRQIVRAALQTCRPLEQPDRTLEAFELHDGQCF